MSTRGKGKRILDEEQSLLDSAKSTILNTFSNEQRDFLKQRLPKKQHKADIIITTALFFHIGLDLSELEDYQQSKKRLIEDVKEALDQVNNMDDSNNMNQDGSNNQAGSNNMHQVKLAEIENQKAAAEARKAEAEARKAEAEIRKIEAEARKAEAEARKSEAETKTQTAFAATARARSAAARHAAMKITEQNSRAAINISRDNAIASSNLTRMLDRQNDNMNIMLRENNILCSPAAIRYQPRLTHTENESIDPIPRGDSVSNEEDHLRPLAEVDIPQNLNHESYRDEAVRQSYRQSNPEARERSPRSSPSFKRSRDDDDHGARKRARHE